MPKKDKDQNQQPTPEQLAKWEKRAPGWRIICLKCGFSEPFGKYGIRKYAASIGKCKIGWCSQCKRLRCHKIVKSKCKSV